MMIKCGICLKCEGNGALRQAWGSGGDGMGNIVPLGVESEFYKMSIQVLVMTFHFDRHLSQEGLEE